MEHLRHGCKASHVQFQHRSAAAFARQQLLRAPTASHTFTTMGAVRAENSVGDSVWQQIEELGTEPVKLFLLQLCRSVYPSAVGASNDTEASHARARR